MEPKDISSTDSDSDSWDLEKYKALNDVDDSLLTDSPTSSNEYAKRALPSSLQPSGPSAKPSITLDSAGSSHDRENHGKRSHSPWPNPSYDKNFMNDHLGGGTDDEVTVDSHGRRELPASIYPNSFPTTQYASSRDPLRCSGVVDERVGNKRLICQTLLQHHQKSSRREPSRRVRSASSAATTTATLPKLPPSQINHSPNMFTRGRKVRAIPTTGTRLSSSTPIQDEVDDTHVGSPSIGPHLTSPGDRVSSSAATEQPTTLDSKGRIIVSISPLRLFVGAVPAPARWFRDILRTQRHEQFFPTFKDVSPKKFEDWWKEFKASYTWPEHTDAEAKAVFKVMCQNRYRDFIYYVKKSWFNKQKPRPLYFTDDVWDKFLQHWGGPEAKQTSERAKKNRASSSGSSTKHTTGSINIAEHQARMTQTYGPHVKFLDVFVRTHTTPGAPDQPRQWIDQTSESTYVAYKTTLDAEVAQGRLKSTEWSPEIWRSVASQGRKKRGERVYGMGEHGGAALTVSSFSQGSPSTTRSHPLQDSLDVQRVLDENRQIKEQLQKQQQIIDKMNAFMEQHQPQSSPSSPNLV